MKLAICFAMLYSSLSLLGATTYTATVDGIKWTYTVSSGEASLGGGTSSSTAIPTSIAGEITIPSILGGYPVTSIGGWAFYGCSGLTSVTIPNSVTDIGSWAFCNCSGLTSVTIPDSVTSIGSSVFSGCSGLTAIMVGGGNVTYSSMNGLLLSNDGKTLIFGVNGDVTIPDSVTSIGSYAFSDCSGLTSVTIPDSVTSIGDSAFYKCSGLTNVTIPNSVTNIGSSAFSYCSGLTSVTIPDSVTSIGSLAFYKCSGLTSVTIPDSVTNIVRAFDGCSDSLYDVTTINGVKLVDGWVVGYTDSLPKRLNLNAIRGIAGDAFYFATLKDVTIKNCNISENAFYYCQGLANVTVSNSTIGESAFHNCKELANVTVSNSTIGESAFQNCSGLTNVTIGSGVANIGNHVFRNCESLSTVTLGRDVEYIAPSALDLCYNLTSFTVADDNRSYKSVAGMLLSKDGEVLVKGIGGDVTIPDGVKRIEGRAFRGLGGLTSVTMPDSVVRIDDAAFYGCKNLVSVRISDSLTIVGSNVFDGTPFYRNQSEGLVVFGNVLYSLKGSSPAEVSIPNGIVSIGPSAFYGCSGLTSVTIPDSVTSIGPSAFYGCSGLTSVTIPDSVTSIGNSTFDNCSRLTNVTIPNSVTNIGSSAFSDCSGLTSVTIPDSVTSIGSYAFSYCSGLTAIMVGGGNATYSSMNGLLLSNDGKTLIFGVNGDVTIPDSVTSIGSSAFSGRSGLTSMTIPNSVTNIGSSAFSGCSGLTSVTIPDSVKSIGDYAFYDCSGLTSVTIPDSVTSIGGEAFSGCSGLTDIHFEGDAPTINSSVFSGVAKNCCVYVRQDSQGWGVTIPGSWQGLAIDYRLHIVTFDANGGDCATAEIRVDDNRAVGELPLPTRFGYAFKGWWTAQEGGEAITAETVVTNALSLFAHWERYVVPSPVITPSDGSVFYDDSCVVTISCGFEGAAIYYSDEGATPKIDDDYLYEAPFEITDTATIKAVAVFEGVKSAYVTVTIARESLPLEVAVEASGIIKFGTDPSVPWRAVVTESAKIGGHCARSGSIGNRSSTWMSASVSGAGTLSFWGKVSCEHDEDNAFSWDRLMVYTNNVEVVDWRMDGETDWTQREVSFEGGENTVKWVYYKDKSGVDGEDCAWVDGVTWTPGGTAAGVAVEVNGAAVEFEAAADGKTRTATVAAGTAAEDIKVFVGGVDVTAGFKVSVEGTTATVVLREPFESADATSASLPWTDNGDGSVTLNVEVVPGLYYAADSAATIDALKRPGAAEPAKAGDAVVVPKQAGAQGFYKVWVSDEPIKAE